MDKRPLPPQPGMPPAAADWQTVQRYRVDHGCYGCRIVAAERYLWLRTVARRGRLVVLHGLPARDAAIPRCDVYRAICAPLPQR